MARVFDIVEFVDEASKEMVHRIPARGSGDFRIGSQVIVRDSQATVFFRDGRLISTRDRRQSLKCRAYEAAGMEGSRSQKKLLNGP